MHRRALLLVVAAILAAPPLACRGGDADRFATRDLPSPYEAALDEVAAIRGAESPAGLRLGLVRRSDLPDLLRRVDSPGERSWSERVTPVYRLLGLIGSGDTLEAVTREVLAGSAGALYVPGRREIWLVTDADRLPEPADLPPWQRRLLAHEFAHALQDVEANLAARLAAADTIDERLALLAVLEGDATWSESQWTTRYLLPSLATGAALEPPSAGAGAPAAILREWQFFSTTGSEWVALTRDASPGVIAALLRGASRLTTAEVLHPGLRGTGWALEQPPFPSLDGGGITTIDTGTLGEFMLQNSLRQRLPALAAVQAAAGWTGDRYALVRGSGGNEGLAIRVRFRNSKEAGEFAARHREALKTASPAEAAPEAVIAALPDGRFVLQFEPQDRDVTFIIATSRSLAEALASELRNQ